MTPEERKPPRQLGGELVIPVLAITFTLYYFSTIWNSPWTAQVSAFLVGGFLMAVCGLFIVRSALAIRRGEGSLGFRNLVSRDDWRTGRVGLFAATVGYCVLVDPLGFTLATFAFLFAGMAVLSRGRHIVRIAWVSALIALVGWAVFIWAFDTRFPRGWFELWMKSVLSGG